MEDARFRRNLIVQFLILFQYLLGFTEEEKDRTNKLIEARPNAKPSLVPPTYTLKPEQAEWIHQVQETILTLLRATKPHGNLYTDIILNMLVYERHWVRSSADAGRIFPFNNFLFFFLLDYLESIRMSQI